MDDISFPTDMISTYFAGLGLRPADLSEQVTARFGPRAIAITAHGLNAQIAAIGYGRPLQVVADQIAGVAVTVGIDPRLVNYNVPTCGPATTQDADVAPRDEQLCLEVAVELGWLLLREAQAWEPSSLDLIDVLSAAAPSDLLVEVAGRGYLPSDVTDRLMRCITRLADVSTVSRRVAAGC